MDGAGMMKHLLILLLCMLALSAPAAGKTLSAKDFTGEFAKAMRAAAPGYAVSVEGELHLKVKAADGTEMTNYLDSAYREYLADPSDKHAILKRHVAGRLEAADDAVPVNPDNIVPVIKDLEWIEGLRDAAPGLVLGSPKGPVVEDFLPGLVIIYGEDRESGIRFFTGADLDRIALDRKTLRQQAVKNLRRLLPEVKLRKGPRLAMLTAGGTYEASLLLLDEIWSGTDLGVAGDIVVAIPSRDVLLLTGSRDEEDVAALRAAARKAMAENSYALTDQLYVFRNGRFRPYAPGKQADGQP